MIFELAVGLGLVVAGVTTARVVARRRDEMRANREDERGDKNDAPPEDAESDPEEPKKKPRWRRKPRRAKPARTGPRGLRVGDVLLYADTELWLAGLVELDEEGLVARLFPTPGAMRSEWVAQLDDEATDLATLSPTDEVPAGSVPESLPIGGRRLTLERRGDAVITTSGEHLPRIGKTARYTLLSDAGGRVALVLDFGDERHQRLALAGERVSRHMVDLLPGGDDDDDDV